MLPLVSLAVAALYGNSAPAPQSRPPGSILKQPSSASSLFTYNDQSVAPTAFAYPLHSTTRTRGAQSAAGTSQMRATYIRDHPEEPTLRGPGGRSQGRVLIGEGEPFFQKYRPSVRHYYNGDAHLWGYSGPGWADNKWARGPTFDRRLAEVYIMTPEEADTGLHADRRAPEMGIHHDANVIYYPGPYSIGSAFNEGGEPGVPFTGHQRTD